MTQYLERTGKPTLAYNITQGSRSDLPLVMFMPGYRSDMEGTKAVYLEGRCKERGQGYLRFDYSGHGVSEGDFNDGTISIWTQDALDVMDYATVGRDVVLVGSSMGGWISLLMALERRTQVCGLVGIAAAPDFTLDIYYNRMDDTQRTRLKRDGYVDVPNEYSDIPYKVTKALIDDGAENLLIKKGIDLHISVRLVQGMRDADVEWQHAHRIKNAIAGDDVEVLLVEDGDHRLSRPEDLALIDRCVKVVSGLAV